MFRELFKTLGGNISIKGLVEAAIERKLIPDEIYRRCAHGGLKDMAGNALKKDGPDGLPYAKPVGRGKNARWQQLVLFKLDQARDLLDMEWEGVKSDVAKFRILLRHFKTQFGDAIPDYPIEDLI